MCQRKIKPIFTPWSKMHEEQLLIKNLIEVCMISTYKIFLFASSLTKKEKSHFKLGTEVYADVTQIKKALEMLLISPGLDTSPLK